jgi:hypothetical protein
MAGGTESVEVKSLDEGLELFTLGRRSRGVGVLASWRPLTSRDHSG